ncbi:putative quinol monooxygenase [Nannocystaceae bacterium ST9]
MNMIVIRVFIEVLPTGRARFVEHIQQEAREVRERFAGVRRYDLFNDPSNPDGFLLYEEWTDRESFRTYRDSDYFVQNRDRLFPLVAGKPDTAYYSAELLD